MVFAAFVKKEKRFPGVLEQISKSLLDGVTIGDRMTKKMQNLRKWVQSLCAPLRPFRKVLYHSLLPHVL